MPETPVERRLSLALAAGRMGIWEFDLRTGAAEWDEQLQVLYGLEPGEFTQTFEAWAALVHPDDVEGVVEGIAHSIEHQESFRFDYRCVWPDGSVHWLEGIGEMIIADGVAVGVIGVTQNIDQRVDAQMAEREARLRAEAAAAALSRFHRLTDEALSATSLDELLRTFPERIAELLGVDIVRIWLVDRDDPGYVDVRASTGIRSANPAARARIGEGFAGRVAQGIRPIIEADLTTVVSVGAALRAEVRSVLGVPLLSDSACLGVLDVGSREMRSFNDDDAALLQIAAERLARAVDRAHLIEMERAGRHRSDFLRSVNDALTTTMFTRERMRLVAEAVVPRLADGCLLVVPRGPNESPLIEVAHNDPSKIELAHRIQVDHPFDADRPTGIADVIRTGRTEYVPVIDDRIIGEITDDPELQDAVRDLGLTSAITVALTAPGGPVGALRLLRESHSGPYGASDVLMAEELAASIGVAIQNAQIFEQQRDIARTLQTSLLPSSLPEIEGIEIATRYWTPAELVEVGGDFYDVFPLSSNRWGITIGDISGKGITAAALTGLARQTIRASARHRHTPSQVLMWLHEALIDQGSRYGGQNCTAMYGILERRRGGFVFRFALGGHPQPVLLTADGGAEFVGRYGTLLGAVPVLVHHEVDVQLGPGDQLVLYTDGVTDVPGSSWLSGDDLVRFVADHRGATSDETAARLQAALDERYENVVERDDTALIVLGVGPKKTRRSRSSTPTS